MIALLAAAALAERPAPVPGPLAPIPFEPPAAVHRTLSNGLPVILVPVHEVPLFDVRLVTRVGEPEGTVPGATSTLFDLLDEGAGGRDAAALAGALRALGAEVQTATNGDWSSVRVRGLSRNVDPALALWGDVIRQPALAPGDLDIVRGRRVQRVQVALKRADALGWRAQSRLLYGDAYLGPSPTVASLGSLTPEAMRALHARIGPANAAVIAGGDVDPDALVALLERELGDWKGGDPVTASPSPRTDTAGKLHVVDLPGAPQSAVMALLTVGGALDPERFPLEVAVEGLGGAFTSRVSLNLREDKGWTYGARCGLSYRAGPGVLLCSSLVRADATAGAVGEVRRELREVVGERPLTADEVTTMRLSLLRRFPSEHETQGALLDAWSEIWVRSLPDDWMSRWLAGIGEVSPERADQALRAALDPARVTWLVVGDLAKVRADLEALGLPLVELAAE